MTGSSDFRSDTVTRPDAEMRRAMAGAEVGDDVFGDDPTVRELEALASRMFGTEAAMFTPSGTMANQCAIAVHTEPGDEVLVHEHAHVYRFEVGGIARLSGAQARPLPGPRGAVPLDVLRSAVRPPNDHMPATTLVCVENTHNMMGGAVLPLDHKPRPAPAAAARSTRL